MNWLLNFRMSLLRGKVIHLRALAEDYDAQAHNCRKDADAAAKRLVQLECRRLLTRRASQECRYG